MADLERSCGPLAFDIFLGSLRRQGFAIGIDHHLRLQQLLASIEKQCGPSELKTVLCPIFATDLEQQKAFYAAFESHFCLFLTAQDEVTSSSSQHVVEHPPSLPARKVPYFLIAGLMIVLAVLAFWKTQRSVNKGPVGVVSQGVQPQRIRVAGRFQAVNLIRQQEPIYPLAAKQASIAGTVHFNAIIAKDGTVQNLTLISGHPLLVSAAQDAIREWLYKPTLLNGEPVEVATEIDVHFPTSAPAKSDSKATQAPTVSETALRPSFWPKFHEQHRAVIYLAVLLLPLTLYMVYRWYRFVRRKLILRKHYGKKPPFSWPIRADGHARNLYNSPQFYTAVRHMHRRQTGNSAHMDLDGSVRATVASLGYPRFQYRPSSRLPEYLLLIDRLSFRDHQAELFHNLAGYLQSQGLFIDVYFFNSDPRVCWSPNSDTPVYLAELERRYYGHRLLLFGNADKLIDPLTGRLASSSTVLLNWNDRAILTPEVPSEWGLREKILASEFLVLPATVEGLLAIGDRFSLSVPTDILSWRRYRPDPVPPEPGDPVLVEALCKYLGEATFKWLCACAVYPELHWDLTLQLGSLVCMDQGLISETNLLRLARLPWFRSGFMSDDLRLPLIRALTQSDERVVSTLRPAETPRVDCAALQTLRALLHSSVLHRTQGDLVHTSVVSVSGNHNTESQKLQYAGRYPPRAGRPLSGPASKELRLSAEPC